MGGGGVWCWGEGEYESCFVVVVVPECVEVVVVVEEAASFLRLADSLSLSQRSLYFAMAVDYYAKKKKK